MSTLRSVSTQVLVLILGLSSCVQFGQSLVNKADMDLIANYSDPKHDMYVINAMVYQVGILTNRTDNETSNTHTGSQETVTFYHNNGTMADLSKIAEPLLTNVTAQNVVAVAPVSGSAENTTLGLPWASLNKIAESPSPSEKDASMPIVSNSPIDFKRFVEKTDPKDRIYKIFRREAPAHESPVKIVRGSAVIPEGAGVQSLAIPPLLTLNNNFSEIPVPIPNTSVVHYAQINTVVSKP